MSTELKIILAVVIFAVVAFIGRLVGLFRRSRAIEKTIDYSKMKEWEEDD